MLQKKKVLETGVSGPQSNQTGTLPLRLWRQMIVTAVHTSNTPSCETSIQSDKGNNR